MKLRLNMIETKCNFKGKYLKNQTCEICNEHLDTTEHLFECKKMDKLKWQFEKDSLKINAPHKNLASFIKEVIKLRKDKGFYMKFGEEDQKEI